MPTLLENVIVKSCGERCGGSDICESRGPCRLAYCSSPQRHSDWQTLSWLRRPELNLVRLVPKLLLYARHVAWVTRSIALELVQFVKCCVKVEGAHCHGKNDFGFDLAAPSANNTLPPNRPYHAINTQVSRLTIASSCPMQFLGPFEKATHALFVVKFADESSLPPCRCLSGRKTCGTGQYLVDR